MKMKPLTVAMAVSAAILLAACKPVVLFTIGGKEDPYAGTELKTESTGKVEKESSKQ